MAKGKKKNAGNGGLINDELRAMYAKCCDLQEIYLSCIRNQSCRSTDKLRHCADCRQYLDLSVALKSALGLKPWHMLDYDFERVEDALAEALEEHPR